MQPKFPAELVALCGAIPSMVLAVSVAALIGDWWDEDVLVPFGLLSLFYLLPLVLVVGSLAPKRVKAGPVLVGGLVVTAICVPLLAAAIGPELALFAAPLLAWGVLALGAIVFVQDAEPTLVPGVCNRCGYDLTGNKTGVCPECGRPAAAPGHVSFVHRWRGALPNQLGRWATAVIMSVLVAMAAAHFAPEVPVYSVCPGMPNLHAQLQTIRSQIELHNVQNPADPFDPIAHGWSQLVDNDYLQMPPSNPLQDGATKIGTAPADGVGWFWASQNGWPATIYAVNEDGGGYDFDGDGLWH